MASNFGSNQIVDSATFHCKKCLMKNVGSTVKQYYVNYDTTINMCSVCKSSYLKETEVTVNHGVSKSVSAKSLKKMPLLHFLLKDTPDELLTQDEAKHVLNTAYQSYRKSFAKEEAQVNDFLSLVSQLLPNQTTNSQQNSRALVTIDPRSEDSNSADSDDIFYFSNGLKLSKSEITDDDIEAAISALSCGNSPAINYEDLPDIDSFLAYSEEVDDNLPILSDETLLSPIHLDKIDENLKQFNENQEIQVKIDFNAMQKVLATPGVHETHENEQPKARSKKVERFLAKSNMRPCDILRKSQQMQLWKQKSANVTSLSKITKGFDEANAETKKSIVDSLNSESSVSVFNINNSNATKSVTDASQSALTVYKAQNYEVIPSDGYSKDDRKMFKGFEFAEFVGEPARVKTKKKLDPKPKNTTLTLIGRLRRQKKLLKIEPS